MYNTIRFALSLRVFNKFSGSCMQPLLKVFKNILGKCDHIKLLLRFEETISKIAVVLQITLFSWVIIVSEKFCLYLKRAISSWWIRKNSSTFETRGDLWIVCNFSENVTLCCLLVHIRTAKKLLFCSLYSFLDQGDVGWARTNTQNSYAQMDVQYILNDLPSVHIGGSCSRLE